MPKNPKRLTRADKINLSKLSDSFASPAEIGVDADSLDNLAAHGHARSILEGGEMRYRITEDGQAFLGTLPAHA